ncbi:hypothetical protein EX895_003488 [Sporisorium graminicola]|uniref:Store-operated calcium entry-associated regulatory factor n=1 Tax=Sporisorium graminicola TaxID=280036 RepID=A0A4U7KSJ5_9BASI|nr:hypothetical protein EX895_003488 [Sporisorium graminicola]TKY87474.1 hypothetical protein EX895_003488 [Sporisorium graminicola]
MLGFTPMRRRAARGTLTLSTFLLLLLLSQAVSGYKPNSPYYGAGRRVAMSSLRTLTFYSDRRTAYRRTSALPQLTCEGSMCSRYQPDVVQCQAMGDGQWKCAADLPSTMRMGRVEVSCEGYDYAEDPYVLKDSCALTYHLLPSGRGPDDPWRSYRGQRNGWGERLVGWLFQMVFWGVLAVIVVNFVRAVRGNAGSGGGGGRAGGGGGGGWGGGGGGGGGGWWPGGSYPPPPPYTPKPEPDSAPSASSWRPGFWTGLGLGGLAATAAASSRRRPPGAGGFYYPPPQAGFLHEPSFSSGFGGRRRGWDDDDRGVGSSSAWRESTGFGGTRNR